jgi:transcriptional regulator with XRE-family HTH domain
MVDDAWRAQIDALGGFIHSQRKLAQLSLRELAGLTNLSNAYLSQVERGLHEPSVRVLKSIATALDLSAETLLEHAGLLGEERSTKPAEGPTATEAAIRADRTLSESQKEALLAVFRSYSRERGDVTAQS